MPEGQRIYAVGDCHGCLDALRSLEEKIARDAAASRAERRLIIYLGDYVDRGPASCQLVDHLIAGPPSGFEAVYLRGNHEAALLDFLEEPEANLGWLVYGGDATLRSYGVEPADMPPRGETQLEYIRRRFAEALPAGHREFMRMLPLWHRAGDYLFVHAGIRPGIPLDEQSEEDLLWIREPFLDSVRDHGSVVVHGHTPVGNPDERQNRIGIDTGACYGGKLTALVLEGEVRDFICV